MHLRTVALLVALLSNPAPAASAAQRAELRGDAATPAPAPQADAESAADAAARIDALAARAGDAAGWAPSWEAAAERARVEGRLVLVALSLLPGFDLADTPRNTTFVDDDVLELVSERFVPLGYEPGMRAPFVERYGLGPRAFGQALLVVTPAGEVIGETHAASDVDVVPAFLRGVLAARPPAPQDAAPEVATPETAAPEHDALDRAARHLARGEHAAARALLADDRSARAERLRATLLRREFDFEGALAAFAAARAAGLREDRALLVEEAQVLMRVGERDAARARLERAADLAAADLDAADHDEGELDAADLDAARRAELLLAQLDLGTDRARAEARLRALALGAPEDRRAHEAAALLRGAAFALDFDPTPGPHDPEVLAELLLPPAPAPLAPDRARAAADGALAWLLAHQRADGGWAVPAALRGSVELGADAFTDATAAIAGRALLARGAESAAALDAAQAALGFVLAAVERRLAAPRPAILMDYTPWSDAFALAFLADARERGIGERARIDAAARGLIDDLAARQPDGGGWSYYLGGAIEGPGAPSHAISFVTAAAVSALARARAAGIDVPDDVLEPGAGVLARMRAEDGAFAYFLFHESGAVAGDLGVEGAVGRGPACELALLAAGRGSDARVRAALERFLEHRALYVAEQGKVVMHAGPHGQGSHYLLFDVAHAALAWRQAGGGPEARVRIVETALACRQADGAFLDMPMLGRAYGTAAALLALDALAG